MIQLVFTLALVIFCDTSQAREISLRESDLPDFVKTQNALVQAQRKTAQSFEVRRGHLARSFLPTASLSAGQEHFQYVSPDYKTQPYYSAQLELNLYNGGKDKLTDELYDIEYEQSKSLTKVKLYSKLEEARKAFWSSVFLDANIKRHQEILKLINDYKRKAIQRIKGGVATRSDRFHFEIKETQLQQEVQKMRLAYEQQTQHLKVLLGLSQQDTLRLDQELAHSHDWRRLVEHSESSHSYLIQPYLFEVQKHKVLSDLNSRKWLPQLDAYALYAQKNQRMEFDRADEEDRRQTAIGLRATWQFSDVLNARVEKDRSHLLAEAGQFQVDFEQQELESELHFEIEELALIDSLVHGTLENVERSKKLLSLIDGEYRRGVKSSEDMLSAIETLLSSEVRHMEVIKDFHYARAHIMAKLGE